MRALIVEDEPLARLTLRDYLAAERDVEWIGEATNGKEAVAAIQELTPDLVFLDVHLPELSGLEVLEHLEGLDPWPFIVFTTAYDRYAVDAFEFEAVDYLVKPFRASRLRATLARVRRRRATEGQSHEGVRSGLVHRPFRRIYARKGNRVVLVGVERIERIEASGDYCELHCEADGAGRPETYLVSVRLKDLEAQLDGGRFVRIHRSHLVNLEKVSELRARDSHRLEVVLNSGAVVHASRSGTVRLRSLMRD